VHRKIELLRGLSRLSVVCHEDRVLKMGHGKRSEFAEAQPRFAASQVAEEVPLLRAGKRNRLRGGELNAGLHQLLLNEIGYEEPPAEELLEKRKPAGKVEILGARQE